MKACPLISINLFISCLSPLIYLCGPLPSSFLFFFLSNSRCLNTVRPLRDLVAMETEC